MSHAVTRQAVVDAVAIPALKVVHTSARHIQCYETQQRRTLRIYGVIFCACLKTLKENAFAYRSRCCLPAAACRHGSYSWPVHRMWANTGPGNLRYLIGTEKTHLRIVEHTSVNYGMLCKIRFKPQSNLFCLMSDLSDFVHINSQCMLGLIMSRVHNHYGNSFQTTEKVQCFCCPSSQLGTIAN